MKKKNHVYTIRIKKKKIDCTHIHSISHHESKKLCVCVSKYMYTYDYNDQI